MTSIESLFGIGSDDPELQLSTELVRADAAWMRVLVSHRKRAGLTQQDVADRLGVTQPTIAAFERYDNDPKLSTIRRYAQVVGAMVDHVVRDHVVRDNVGRWHRVGSSTFAPTVVEQPSPNEQVPVSASGVTGFALAA